MNRWAAWLRDNGPGRFQLASKTGWDTFVNTAPRADLDVLTRAEMASLSPEELEDYTEARMVWNANLPTVKTHQLTSAFATIDQVMASNYRDADRLRGSVVVDASPGLGKTTIATRYARDFHRRTYRRLGPKTSSGHQRLPVAFVPLSAGITLKGLNQKILAFYGHPAANRASSARLGALAVDCVASCETQLVVIDDLHFVDFRHRHGMEVSNHLKGLANEMPVTFIYVGVRLREKRFFDEGLLGPDAVYAQTSRRATRCEVAPFDITTEAGMRGWTDLLRALEVHLKLVDARPGMLTDHAKELHRRTQGHIASLTTGPATSPSPPASRPSPPSCSLAQAPTMPLKPSPTPAEPAAPQHRLRPVTGGYDLDPLPIHVPPQDGESAVSWLRRLSVRYDTPARDLLHGAGAVKAITGTTKVISRLRNNRALLERLGLDGDETSRLLTAAPLTSATLTYTATFGRTPAPARPWMRYCPHCLAHPDPVWPDHWRCPLSLICPDHGVYLLQTCPDCGQQPHNSPAWLTHPVELNRCPSRVHEHDAGPGRRRLPWCDTDLSAAPTMKAPPEQVAGQRLLHDWAAGTAEHATACGLPITHRLGFQALVELLDAQLGGDEDLLELANNPATVAAALPAAVQILAQPDLDSAAQALSGRLSYSGPHAPLGPAWRIADHHYSPILAAVQLHSVRDQLPAADQLMFRIGHPAPRYPATVTVALRRRLRLPDHHPHRPEPQISWIPQTIWPLAVPAALIPCTRAELRGTMLAMCLAKMGSTARWSSICDDLAFPTSHATRIGSFLRYIRRAGHWPDVLASLERLMTLLQQHPPPIDYTRRREHTDRVDAFADAIDDALRIHFSPRPRRLLTRQLWERFSGSDIAHAPAPLRIKAPSTDYTAYRRHRPVWDADLFHVAHRGLQHLLAADGPLSWTPRATAEPELPDIRARCQEELE